MSVCFVFEVKSFCYVCLFSQFEVNLNCLKSKQVLRTFVYRIVVLDLKIFLQFTYLINMAKNSFEMLFSMIL